MTWRVSACERHEKSMPHDTATSNETYRATMNHTNAPMNRRDFFRVLAAGAATVPFACAGGAQNRTHRIPATDDIRKDFSAAYGIVPPLVTPFTDDGRIDHYALEHLVDWHVAQGVSGVFVVCGSGEYYRLEPDEVVAMAQTTRRAAAGRAHVLIGSTNHRRYEQLDQNIELTRRVADTGVDGCFITPPNRVPEEYESSVDEKMREYMIRVHDAVDCPVFAYEIPSAAFRYQMTPETVGALAECERFVGMKDTSTREDLPAALGLSPVRRKLEQAHGSMKILQANTKYLLESWKIGCTGGINTSANVAPGLFVKMYDPVSYTHLTLPTN